MGTLALQLYEIYKCTVRENAVFNIKKGDTCCYRWALKGY